MACRCESVGGGPPCVVRNVELSPFFLDILPEGTLGKDLLVSHLPPGIRDESPPFNEPKLPEVYDIGDIELEFTYFGESSEYDETSFFCVVMWLQLRHLTGTAPAASKSISSRFSFSTSYCSMPVYSILLILASLGILLSISITRSC